MADSLNILMEMSSVYEEEGWPDLCPHATRLDFRSLEGTSCYCGDDASANIREAISGFGASGIHWIDSGDYHYLSLFWLEKLRDPFSLVLFDHHPDMQEPLFPMLSCGSWVKEALRLSNLRSALLLGISPALLSEAAGDDRVRAICEGDPLLDEPEAVAALLPRDVPVYFSIDKDVLGGEYARTGWDQGSMSLDTLAALVRSIRSGRRMAGADICGELPESKGAMPDDLRVNLDTNRRLLSILQMS